MKPTDVYKETLEQLQQHKNYRTLPKGPKHSYIDLCSNDYLGIANDTTLYYQFLAENDKYQYQFGSSSSRLLSSNSKIHSALEKSITKAYKTESALVYNSGYHTNIGILSAIPQKQDLIIADKKVHASIIDGAKLSQANCIRFRHLDYNHLESLLNKYRDQYQQIFIVSESIFSMDGDVSDLKALIYLKHKYNTYLYIDEAHAFGVIGNNGLGYVETVNCIDEVDFIVGAFGKSMGSVGGFVTCKDIFKQYLINHSRSFIFSTAIPPINVAWTHFLFKKLPLFNDRRLTLNKLQKDFGKLIQTETKSHIIPYIVGSNKQAIDVAKHLRKQHFFVLPIRYPTVPKNTARLRFSLNASMSIDDLKPIQKILSDYGQKVDKAI